jgi:hypothetical protein
MISCYLCRLYVLTVKALKICAFHGGKLYRVWKLPYTTHCYLLPLLSQCLSLEYEICRWPLHFIRECLCNCLQLVSTKANHGIHYGRYNLFLGHNALFCSNKFNVNVCDIVSGEMNVSHAVNKYAIKTTEERQIRSVSFLCELVLLRDNYLVFSNNGGFNRYELNAILHVICID